MEEDGDLLVYRGRRKGDGEEEGVLVAVPALDPPAPATLDRLVHEFALKDDLEPAWAAQPLDLLRERGRILLVLEDPGGVPLTQLLVGRPMETGRFLKLAVQLVEAVGKAHERGLIHKDIRPAHIFVDEAGGGVHLTGFGSASRLLREHLPPEQAELRPDALAYMAPEVTGRMNRSVDTRSDLYSVGVVLYEMLTGVLPFSASDPMEWVHSHIARDPTPPAEHAPDAPPAIVSIILKCLAKTAEDRYQTATGLAADLRHCLAEWESAGSLEPFTPGDHDIPDVLRIPEKLYGRETEVAQLLEAFERVVAGDAPELVLVCGHPGVGKSSVVNELHKALVPTRGLFASGKFDQYKRDIPYSTLAQAFRGLIRRLLGKNEAELDRWRNDLRAALEPNAALIANLVPDLKLIIGEPPPVPELPPQDAEPRFRQVLRRFISVFARPEHPLALFLDDLQWLDAATLSLLSDLTIKPDVGPLLLVGAYRDNEVDASHPLMRSISLNRRAGGRVTEIALSPLGQGDVGRLVADSLRCTPEEAADLANLIFDKTRGNPFFTIQFLKTLAEEKLLAFSPGEGRWVWDLQRIRAMGYTDNVVELMVGKLARLPQDTQEALQGLAALGDSAQSSVLGLVLERDAEAVHAALWPAVQAGLVLRQDGTYVFLHDRVHEAAYSQIPEASRAERHLRIGRVLAASLPPEEIVERIFEVVAQLNRGAALVDTPQEREAIAELDLKAGERAKAAAAYAVALTYLTAGARLLGADRWERRFDLAFALELDRAECEFLTGATEAADRRLAELWGRAANTVDRAAVTWRRLALYTATDRSDLAVEASLEYLRQVGIVWSVHPTPDEVRQEFDTFRARLGERSIESLIDLPLMEDAEQRARLEVLVWAQASALFTDANLYALIVARAANLSLEFGNSDASAVAYVKVGQLLGGVYGDYEGACRFGRLAQDLIEKKNLRRFRAQVDLNVGHFILPWRNPVREGVDLIRRAAATAQETGNLTYLAFCAGRSIALRFAAGDPLGEVQADTERALEHLQRVKVGLYSETIATMLRLVRTLRGLTPALGSFNDADFDEAQFEAQLEHGPGLARLFWYRVRKLQACVFAGDFTAAAAVAAKAEPLLWTSPGFFEVAEHHFYAALACAGGCTAAEPDEARRDRLAALRVHRDKLATWAANCPANFADRVALVDAETARIEGRELEAMRLYDQAVRSAHDNGFVHIEALANERASRFYFDLGFEKSGFAYLRDARAGYLLWGARGKVRQLDELYPQQAAHEAAICAGAADSAVGQLDAATLIKASQAVSSEIDPPRLIEALMTITLQNAGADRGLLLLPRDGAFQIEAEARASGPAIEVRLRRAPMTAEDGPEAVVNLVIRTCESSLLEDGSRLGPVWEYAFRGRAPPRSALCLPLLRQGRLAGVLYLENGQAAYAFTARRLAVLEVLAAQAAIALENARLYGDLQAREAKIRRLVESNIIGIVLASLEDGRVTEANDAFLALVGYDRDDLRAGRISWTEMTPPEWQDADRRAVEQTRAEGFAQPYEKEYLRKDGGRVPVLVGPAAYDETRDEALAFVLDLTEPKQAETRLKLMVGELNHRVKNTLATVSAIAAQSLRTATSLDAFREAFQARLAALSKTHNLLNQAYWAGVGLRDLVKQALSPYAGEGEGRVVIQSENIRLGPIAAVTLGMALHELASNAVKYGALSTPSGQVRVVTRATEPGRVQLVWEERGGPPVQPPSRRGFGTELIQKALAAELHGEVRLEFPPPGVRCVMDMALDRVSTH